MYYLSSSSCFSNGAFLKWSISQIEHFSNVAFLKWSISQMEHFSNGAILKWSDSQMERFSNGAILKWSNSQMEQFSNGAIWGRHHQLDDSLVGQLTRTTRTICNCRPQRWQGWWERPGASGLGTGSVRSTFTFSLLHNIHFCLLSLSYVHWLQLSLLLNVPFSFAFTFLQSDQLSLSLSLDEFHAFEISDDKISCSTIWIFLSLLPKRGYKKADISTYQHFFCWFWRVPLA